MPDVCANFVAGNCQILLSAIYGWFFDGYRDWQMFIGSHPDQVLVVYYEDMHKVNDSVVSYDKLIYVKVESSFPRLPLSGGFWFL